MEKIGIYWLLLVLCSVSVFAAAEGPLIVGTTQSPGAQQQTLDQLTQNAVDLRVSESNKYLSAEASRQITAAQEEMLKQINANNDENFRVFDQRMSSLMTDIKLKVIVGGIGAILIANAIVGLAFIYVTRRYSYEYYLEKVLKQHLDVQKEPPKQKEVEEMEKGLAQMQQQAWAPQQPAETMSTMFGQAAASQMTDMNQWQFQPAYEGAWKRAEQPVSHVEWEAQTGSQQGPVDQPDFVHPFEDEQNRYRTEGYNARY